MIVMLDTFDGTRYPLYLHGGRPMPALQDMQKVGEEFDLFEPFDQQFHAFRGSPKSRSRELDV
jgi:hypothetical protein